MPPDPAATASAWCAMELAAPGRPLQQVWRQQLPQPGPGQVRIRVAACGVCRTDLHVVDGELPWPGHAVVPGHEIVGRIGALGAGVTGLAPRAARRRAVAGLDLRPLRALPGRPREPVPAGALHRLATRRRLCRAGAGRRPLRLPAAAGLQRRAGRAAAVRRPDRLARLCHGRRRQAQRIGLYGFGAAAHLIAQVAVHQGREVYAFTRPGDTAAQELARRLGAAWAGDSDQAAAAGRWTPRCCSRRWARWCPTALQAVRPGGTVVCAGIHMSDIPSFPYRWLWGERRIVSVANLTRQDGVDFLRVAAEVPLQVSAHTYPLAQANQALDDLRAGRFAGAAVLVC